MIGGKFGMRFSLSAIIVALSARKLILASLRPYFAFGRKQLRLGFRYQLNEIERYRWIGLTWQ